MSRFRIILLALFAVFVSSIGYAQDSAGTGKIYFVRHTGYNGAALSFHCFIDSSRVCDLRNNKYSVHEVPAGEHKLNVTTYSKKLKITKNTLTVTIEKGKTYYIKILPEKSYSFETTLKILAVSESIIKPVMDKCEVETQCLR